MALQAPSKGPGALADSMPSSLTDGWFDRTEHLA
jgi:hypothetical protein